MNEYQITQTLRLVFIIMKIQLNLNATSFLLIDYNLKYRLLNTTIDLNLHLLVLNKNYEVEGYLIQKLNQS